ncbi:MAG: hypothetical protein WCI50_01630 [Actinomycetes bacterium]
MAVVRTSERTSGRGSRPVRPWIDATVLAFAALVGLAVVWRLWDADLGIPFVYLQPDRGPLTYAPDAPFYLMLAKGAISHGWFLSNPALGWPFGQALHEFPQGLDNLNLIVLQVFAWLTGNPSAAVNLLFLSTFVGIPVVTYLAGRRLGLSRLAGGVVALLFTFLPYHFARGTAHVFLSCSWLVPLAGLLLVEVVSDRPPFTRDAPRSPVAPDASDGPEATVDTRRRRDWRVCLRSRSSLWWFLACAGLASTGSYYAAIAMTLLVGVVLVDALARRRGRVVASAGIALAAIFAVVLFNLLPTFVSWAEHGRNTHLVQRGPSETEVNGLKISQLVLPVEGHRIGFLAAASADSTRFTVIPAERGQQLGAIGAVGFVALLGAVLVAARRRRGAGTPDAVTTAAVTAAVTTADAAPNAPPVSPAAPVASAPVEVLRTFGVATVIALVIAAVSGFSLIISGLGVKEIRSWNRVSVFIGFFALVAVGFGIDWARRRFAHRRWIRPVSVVVCALLVVVGVLDQVSPLTVPHYAATRRTFDSDRVFFGRVQRTLPKGAAVFDLPYVFFPESGAVDGIGPYDTVRGFLHTDDLNWSWGGVIGTPADWVAATAHLTETDPAEMLDRVTAVGFRGLVLDRRGDRSTASDASGPREQAITAHLGAPENVSPDGTLAFWDLRPWAREARARLGPAGWRAKRGEALADRAPDARAVG